MNSQVHTKEHVERVVEPHVEGLRECVLESWDLWRASDHARSLRWKTVMGNAMCNYFLNVATHKFYASGGRVHVETKRPYVGLFVESKLFLRFKKGQRNLRTCNAPTQSAKAFHDKSMRIEALEGMARLELVYVLTPDQLDVERIMLVSKDKGRIDWTIDLLARAEPEQTVIDFPQPSPAPQGPTAARVVKKKGGTSDERKQQSAGKGS
ncbi:MAG: hypothetical protein ACN6OP_09655 [Pseudomonadales bacterium]